MSLYKSDVIIIGGGVAGVCAAIAARRQGARVLLIEKNQYFGGMATGAWVHSCLTFHGRLGHRIIDGIPEEIIQRLVSIGGSTGHIRDTIGVAYSVTITDPERLKMVLHNMLEEEGVDCLLETFFTGVNMDGDRIKSINGIHCGGTFEAEAPVYIDTSGEGILAHTAGNTSETGRNGNPQPATLIFKVRNVNFKPIFRYVWKHMDDFHVHTRFDLIKKSPAPGLSGFFRLWKLAELNVPRDRLLFYRTMWEDEVGINSTRIIKMDPTNPEHLTNAHKEARRQIYEILDFLQEWIPGFGFCTLSGEAPLLGIREVRRIRGKYILTSEDLKKGQRFGDEIAFGGFPIDIHSPSGSDLESEWLGGEGFYGIPYRCLLPEKTPNLLIAGKCFSSDFEAHASARVQATSMAMGQAAGVAAALSYTDNKDPVELSPVKVRDGIADLGGLLTPAGKENLA